MLKARHPDGRERFIMNQKKTHIGEVLYKLLKTGLGLTDRSRILVHARLAFTT